MRIGQLARKAGVTVDTLRFYERQGIITTPRRLMSGYRNYSDEALDRLLFVKDAKGLGFSLREIRELLSLGVKSTHECGPITRKAEAKLFEMTAEIVRLQRLQRTLRKMIRDCQGCTYLRLQDKEQDARSNNFHQPRLLGVPRRNELSLQARSSLRGTEHR
jgi:MerR family copper efflux transcriptional regulator